MNSTPIYLLYGGVWDERPISADSAGEVWGALEAGGLEVHGLRWDKGGWTCFESRPTDLLTEKGPAPQSPSSYFTGSDPARVTFNCLHGGPGEDGTVQGFFETLGIPYCGGSVRGGAVSGHKQLFRQVAEALDIPVAPGREIFRADWLDDADAILRVLSVKVTFPMIVKPIASGSSYGMYRCQDADELHSALETSLQAETSVLVEHFVDGREYTVPCLGTRPGQPCEVLPIVEIEPLTESGYFDLEAKYQPGMANEIVPAAIDEELGGHFGRLSARLHNELDLGAVSRTDIIMGADGPVFLETQTIPGLTSGSLLPKSAAAAGLDLFALCRRMIDYAIHAQLVKGVL